jgi:hypothetical protein
LISATLATLATLAMWMKDTWLSLDMIFIAADGTIVYIAARTTPHSTEIISPPGPVPVAAVLEVRGGTARAANIRVGDRVEHPIFQAHKKDN